MKIDELINAVNNNLTQIKKILKNQLNHEDNRFYEIQKEMLDLFPSTLESIQKEQNELIEENKRLKAKLLAAQVFDYDDLSDQAKKDFLIKDGK